MMYIMILLAALIYLWEVWGFHIAEKELDEGRLFIPIFIAIVMMSVVFTYIICICSLSEVL